MAPTSIKRRSPSVSYVYRCVRKCASEIPGCASLSLSHSRSLARRKKRAREREFNFNSRNVKKNHSIAQCNMYVGRSRVESTLLRADESSSNVYHMYGQSCPLTLQFYYRVFPHDRVFSAHFFTRRFCNLYAGSARTCS